jgi:hypothetical protein
LPERSKLKRCRDCEQELSLSEFHRDAAKRDGLRIYCKRCNRARVGKWEKANRGKRREQVRRYNRRHADKARERAARNRDPYKDRARNAVNNALKAGTLRKPESCERCGGNEGARIEGHHPDYERPLEVEWLCSVCHKAEHKTVRMVGEDRRLA